MYKQHKEETAIENLTSAAVMEVPHARQSDEQLLLEYRTTEDAAIFAELVSRYERELYNYLRRFLGDGTMAEDVFQATFLQVHLKSELFESGRKFRPWLYTIATNQAIDAQRRNRRHRRLSLDQTHRVSGEDLGSLMEVVVSQEAGPHDAAAGKERAEWVRDAVANLPDPLQNAVKLVYFRGMKYRDAAKLMSVSVGTVKSRLHSAIQLLSQSWRDLHSAGRS
ncbi:MAG: RNA polymerase sigma factor [Pirellulales bacterium]|nr:RNA polymerase sigma factor [Pirellulales bacterium]